MDGQPIHQGTHSPEQLEGIVGKELTQKIMNGEGTPVKGPNANSFPFKRLSGDNLKVGGEGMKGFYDKIIPDYLNKIGKKYGAKVEDSTIQTHQPNVIPPQGTDLKTYGKQKVHSITITPAFRKALLKEGLPMFAKGGKIQRMADGGAIGDPSQQSDSSGLTNVVDPDTGEIGSLPQEHLNDAINQGYRLATPDEVNQHFQQQQYGGAGQQAMTVGEGMLQGLVGPAGPITEQMAGVNPQGIKGRAATNPGEHNLGQGLGLIAPALIPGAQESLLGRATLGGMMSTAGEAAGEVAGQAIARPALAKLGSNVVKLATENSVFAAADEASKMVLDPQANPADAVETAATNIGLAALLGGAIGVPYSAVSPLWQAASKSQLGSMLSKVATKVGGVEGISATPMDEVLGTLGIEVPPEVRATLSGDPEMQRMARVLAQTDTAKAGKDFQTTLDTFRNNLGEAMVKNLGKDPADIPGMEVSNYQSGKTSASHWRMNMTPR